MIKNKRATILIKTYRMKTNRIWWVCLLGEFFFFLQNQLHEKLSRGVLRDI